MSTSTSHLEKESIVAIAHLANPPPGEPTPAPSYYLSACRKRSYSMIVDFMYIIMFLTFNINTSGSLDVQQLSLSGDTQQNTSTTIFGTFSNISYNSKTYNLLAYSTPTVEAAELNVKIYNKTGQFTTGFQSVIVGIRCTVLKQLKVIVTSSSSNLKEVWNTQIDDVNNVISTSVDVASQANGAFVHSYLDYTSTNYIILGCGNDVKSYDITTNTHVINKTPGGGTSYIYNIHMIGNSQNIILTYYATACVIVDISTLTNVKLVYHAYLVFHSAMDNLDTDKYFLNQVVSMRILKASINTMISTGGITELNAIVYSRNGNNIVNFGPYQYFFVLPSVNSGAVFEILMIQKDDLVLNTTFNFGSTVGCYEWSFLGLIPDNEKYYFSFVDKANGYINSYSLTYDTCFTRNPTTFVCDKCYLGYSFLGKDPWGSCVLSASPVPDGYGLVLPVAPGPVLLACSQTGCLKCAADYTTCTQCNGTAGYYVKVSELLCYTSLSMNDYEGPNLLTYEVEPCMISGCVKCPNDKDKCTSCNKTLNRFHLSPDDTCLSPGPTMPASKGPDLVTGEVVDCLDTHCTKCSMSHLLCEVCDTVGGFYLYETTSGCLDVGSMPPGKGPNLVSGIVVACNDTTCEKCNTSYAMCTVCNQSLNGYLDVGESKCYIPGSMPFLKGPNLITRLVESCSVQNCKSCQLDYLKCDYCVFENGYYLFESNNTCVTIAGMPDYYGGNVDTGIAVGCNNSKCLTCREDYRICSRCDVNKGGCLKTEAKDCIDFDDISELFGCNLTTGVILPCRVLGCRECKADRFQCSRCQISLGYYFENDTCFDIEDAPLGHGLNVQKETKGKCVIPHCISCRSDIRFCIACDSSAGYTLIGGKCIRKDDAIYLSLKKTISLASTQSILVKFDRQTQFNKSNATMLNYSLEDLGKGLKFDNPADFELNALSDGFEVKINLIEDIFNGKMIIDVKPEYINSKGSIFNLDDPNGVGFSDFPIVITGVLLLGKEETKKIVGAGTGTVSSATSGRAVVTLALIQSNPAISILLDKLFCDLSYLSLTLTEKAVITRGVFIMIEGSNSIPFIPENPFKNFILNTEDGDCELSPELTDNDYHCGFLSNYGEDLTFLAATLAINIVLTMLGCFRPRLKKTWKVNNKKSKMHLVRRLVLRSYGFITLNMGLRYFFMKMEGNILEIVGFSLLNISTMKNNWPMWAGLLISISMISFYLFYCYTLVSFVLRLKKDLSDQKKCKDKYQAELQDAFDFRKYRFGTLLEGIYDGFRYPIKPSFLFFPLVSLIRYTALAATIVFLSGTGIFVPLTASTIECAFFIYALKTEVKDNKLENWIEQFNSFIHTVFNLLAALTYLEIDQNYMSLVDIGLFGSLILKIGVNCILLIYILMLELYDAVSSRTCNKPYDILKNEPERLASRLTKPVIENRERIMKIMKEDPAKLTLLNQKIYQLIREKRQLKDFIGNEIISTEEAKSLGLDSPNVKISPKGILKNSSKTPIARKMEE